jgi:nicotinamidase-related amidase
MSSSIAKSQSVTDKSVPSYYGPSDTALLLLDFHSIFVYQAAGPEGAAALKTAATMRSWAKLQGIQVIHCLIDVNDTPFSTCKNGDHLATTVAAMTASGGEEPPELLQNNSDDVTFTRRPGQVSALKSPGLEEYLQKKGIRSLLLAGLSTSGCVARTAFAAGDAEYVVTVISDGCADGKDGIHDVFVGKVLNKRGHVATAADVQEWFIGRSGNR